MVADGRIASSRRPPTASRSCSATTRLPRTWSRRSARACSRRCPRWASRRSRPTAARRSSRRSASAKELIDKHFTGTASRIGGVGIDVLATEALERHARAYPAPPDAAAAGRRRVRVAARRRAPHVEPRDDRARCSTPSREPKRLRDLQRVRALVNERRGSQGDAARPAADRRPRRSLRGAGGPARRGRAGERDRQALLAPGR